MKNWQEGMVGQLFLIPVYGLIVLSEVSLYFNVLVVR